MYNKYGAAEQCVMNSCKTLAPFLIKWEGEKVQNGGIDFLQNNQQHLTESCHENRYTQM